MAVKKFFSEFGFEPKINNAVLMRLKSPNIFNKTFFGSSRVSGRLPYEVFKKYFYPEVNSRILEYAFAFQNLPEISKGKEIKVMDFGCAESTLPIQMASLGYKVSGFDLQDYYFEHRNFKFYQGDFLKNNLKSGTFDIATGISSIEHSGLGSYESPVFSDGDKKVMQEIKRLLKAGGKLIVTVPFGQRHKDEFLRNYDIEALKFFVSDFKIVKERYFMRNKEMTEWFESTKQEVEKLPYDAIRGPDGVACLVCMKEK